MVKGKSASKAGLNDSFFAPALEPLERSMEGDEEDGGRTIVNVSYIDDCSFFLTHATPWALLYKMEGLVTIVVFVFHRFGFCLYLSPGKTELHARFAGLYATVVNRQTKNHKNIKVKAKVNGFEVEVNVAVSYKHVGSVMTTTSNLFPEGSYRARSRDVAYDPFSARIVCLQ